MLRLKGLGGQAGRAVRAGERQSKGTRARGKYRASVGGMEHAGEQEPCRDNGLTKAGQEDGPPACANLNVKSLGDKGLTQGVVRTPSEGGRRDCRASLEAWERSGVTH